MENNHFSLSNKFDNFVRSQRIFGIFEEILRKYILNSRVLILYIIYVLLISFSSALSLFLDWKPISIPSIFLYFREAMFFLIIFGFSLLTSNLFTILISVLLLSIVSLNAKLLGAQNELILMGIKSTLPGLLLFCSPNEFKKLFGQINWLRVSKYILVLNLFLQVFHLFYGVGYYAKLDIGLNARNPGLFFYPAASAMFTLVLFAHYLFSEKKVTFLWSALYTLSILLCSSLTGIFGLAFLLFYKYFTFSVASLKRLMLAFILIIPGILFLHFGRSSMNGPVYYLESSTGRIKIFKAALQNTDLWPSKFGNFTNVAAKSSGGVVPDSFYTSLLGNLGLVWTGIFLIYFVYGFVKNQNLKRNKIYLYLFMLGSVSINMPEAGLPMLMLIIFKSSMLPKQNESIL